MSDFDGGVRVTDPTNSTATAGIFATYPQHYLTAGEGVADQIVGTALLLLAVMAITDKRNANVPPFVTPLMIGFSVFAIGATYGYNCGYAINPARDLSPRIFTALAGWGVEVFKFRDYNWFWVPIVGPHVGAIFGVVLYLLLVGFHWEDNSEDNVPEVVAEPSGTQGTTNSTYTAEPHVEERDDTKM